MKEIFSAIKNFLRNHPSTRSFIRKARWNIKRVPLLRDFSIFFDSKYFDFASEERPDFNGLKSDDEYFESYAGVLAGNAYGKVLDLGCGHGYLTERISKNENVKNVIGVDKIESFRRFNPKIKYLTMDLAGDLSVLPNDFDVVISSEFIEHISEENFKKLLIKITQILKPEGIFIGSTPMNPTNYKVFSGSKFHVREYNKKDLGNILKDFFNDVSIFSNSQYCLIWEAKKKKNFKR
ncbi:MAG: class I SAM-dependent methyltransferase [Candidatus Wolfebacteria bacterium]|nr:class I SAM-dependent methyltransferase [Candidatus Wolfebacteria bacterium]